MNKREKSYDDFFGSDSDDDNGIKDSYSKSNELERTAGQLYPIGYQDGLEEGKEKTLQIGFNDGLRESAIKTYNWSLLLGLISSLDVFYHNKQIPLKDGVSLEALIQRIKGIVDSNCGAPTVDQLKSKFINYHPDLDELKELNTNNNRSSSTKINGGCCGGNSDDCCDNTSKDDVDDDQDGCCGGNNDESCCKSTQTKKKESPSSSCCTSKTSNSSCKPIKDSIYIFPNNQQEKELFDSVSKDCIDVLVQLGLNGEKIIKDLFDKKLQVKFN